MLAAAHDIAPVHESCLKRGKIKQHRGCLAAQGLGPQPKVPQTPYTSLCVQRKSPGTVLVQRQRKTKGQRRGRGVISASGAAAGAGTLAPAAGQSPGLSAGHNAPVAGIGCKHTRAAQQLHFGACRHPPPGCELLGLACCLAEKRCFLRLTSPGRARRLPNGWRGGPCPGKLTKFAYGEGEPPAEQEHVGATTPSRRAGAGPGHRRGSGTPTPESRKHQPAEPHAFPSRRARRPCLIAAHNN